MELVEGLLENEIPGKRAMMGCVALTHDKVMFFGGISEQSGISRDTCFIYDLGQATILKTNDIKLAERDAFPGEGYHYVEDAFSFIVAGRYYVHRLDKQTLQWSVIPQHEHCARQIVKSHNDVREDANMRERVAKKANSRKNQLALIAS